jgi:hypothetical protein
MTFRTFTSPDEFFDLLTGLYRMQPPANMNQIEIREWREKRFRPTQKRILTILTMWLEDFRLLQEEPHIAQRLTDFLVQIGDPPSLALTAQLILRSLERLVRVSSRLTYTLTVDNPPRLLQLLPQVFCPLSLLANVGRRNLTRTNFLEWIPLISRNNCV